MSPSHLRKENYNRCGNIGKEAAPRTMNNCKASFYFQQSHVRRGRDVQLTFYGIIKEMQCEKPVITAGISEERDRNCNYCGLTFRLCVVAS